MDYNQNKKKNGNHLQISHEYVKQKVTVINTELKYFNIAGTYFNMLIKTGSFYAIE